MAKHYNSVTLIGNTTGKPELKTTKNNNSVCEVSLAINRNYQDSSGEWQENTSYVDITLWGNNAENVAQYVGKGDRVFVNGRLEQDRWENEAGEKRSKLKVVAGSVSFIDSGAGESEGSDDPDEILDDVDVEDTKDDIPF